MNVNSVAAIGLQGIQKGMQGLSENAASIASVGTTTAPDTANLTEAMVAMKQNELQVAASTAVIKHANESIGTLLDVLA